MKTIVLSLNCKLEINNVCKVVEGHCLQAMKIVRHHANGRFDWLISGHQSVTPSREAISILSSKYKDLRLSTLWLTDSLGQLSLKRCHSIYENIPRWLTKARHEITLATHTDGQQVTYYRNCLFVHIQ